MQDKLKELGLNEGTGADGVLPTSRNLGRTTDGQGCKDVEAEWMNFNSSGSTGVPGVEGELNETAVDNTVSSLDRINNKLV